MKLDRLILKKIIKIVATRLSDFKAKMHQIRFAGFQGPTSKVREGKGGKGREGRYIKGSYF